MRYATNVVSATSGILFAAAGIEHGVGEMLQGSVPPPGLVFPSWPDSEFLLILSGEPAMSVIPNLFLTGLITVIVALTTIGWSLLLLKRKRGAWGQVALYILLLIVGGGVAPPIMGIILGIGAARAEASLAAQIPGRHPDHPTFLAKSWRVFLILGLVGYLGLLPGVPLLNRFLGIESAALIGCLALFSFSALLLALRGALASDRYEIDSAHSTAG